VTDGNTQERERERERERETVRRTFTYPVGMNILEQQRLVGSGPPYCPIGRHDQSSAVSGKRRSFVPDGRHSPSVPKGTGGSKSTYC